MKSARKAKLTSLAANADEEHIMEMAGPASPNESVDSSSSRELFSRPQFKMT